MEASFDAYLPKGMILMLRIGVLGLPVEVSCYYKAWRTMTVTSLVPIDNRWVV